jgi:hypothetical protein
MPEKQLTQPSPLEPFLSVPPTNLYRFPLKAIFGKLQPATHLYLFSLKAIRRLRRLHRSRKLNMSEF